MSPASHSARSASRTGSSIGGSARCISAAASRAPPWNAPHGRPHTGSARRAMSRLRRNPGPIAARVRSARSVLIVCHGNIIRSPFAAQVVKQAVNGTRSVSVASAGLEAVPGKPAHPRALQLANARQIDLGCHAAMPHHARARGAERRHLRHGHSAARHAAAAFSGGRQANVPPDVPRAGHAARSCRSGRRRRLRVPRHASITSPARRAR